MILNLQILSIQVQNVTADYIMKCDDDTFVRVDSVLKQIDRISPKRSLYMGNLNLLHRPLRNGKWAVTYEVCQYIYIYTSFWNFYVIPSVCLLHFIRSHLLRFILDFSVTKLVSEFEIVYLFCVIIRSCKTILLAVVSHIHL